MKNILITGAKGFIGRHLTKHLQSTHTVVGVDIDSLDLLDKDAVHHFISENKIDFIIHCAAAGVKINNETANETALNQNLDMFHHLTGFCPMIVLGSGAEYDKRRDIHKVLESEFGESVPTDPYGYAKYLISSEIEKMDNVLNLRLFGVYGYGENPTRAITSMINSNLNHQDIVLNQNAVFDFLYIKDLCKIVQYFIENKTNEKFINVTPNQSVEIVQLANMVNDLSDFKSNVVVKNEGLNKEYTGDNAKLLSIMGDFNFTSYQDGIKEMIGKMTNDN